MADDETRACAECGSENPEGAAVCGACGAGLSGVETAAPTSRPLRTSTFARASLVSGLIAAACFVPLAFLSPNRWEARGAFPDLLNTVAVIASVVAVVCGILGFIEIKRYPDQMRGTVTAAVGVLLGLAASVVMQFYFLLAVLGLLPLVVVLWLTQPRGQRKHDATGPSNGRPPLSNLAQAAAVLAALTIPTFGLAAPFAIVAGVCAMVQLATSRGCLRGWGWAIGGTLFPAVLLGLMAYPVVKKELELARKTQCLSNVKRLADALRMYASDYGAFPPSEQWESRSLRQYVEGDKVYVCPSTPKLRSGYAYNSALSGVTSEAIGDAGRTVGVFESDRGWNAAGGSELLARVPRHYKGDNVGFVDGHAKWYLRQALISKENADYFVWEPPAPGTPATP